VERYELETQKLAREGSNCSYKMFACEFRLENDKEYMKKELSEKFQLCYQVFRSIRDFSYWLDLPVNSFEC